MLNKQSILNAISRYVNPQKAQSLSEAFDVANNLLNAANNPEEVFKSRDNQTKFGEGKVSSE